MIELVHVDRLTFRLNDSGTVSAGLWFNFGQAAFPEENWDDFAAAVLTAAVEAVLRLLDRVSEAEKVLFMEGPFHLRMEVVDEVRMTVSAISRQGKDVVEHAQIIDTVAFAVDLCAAAEQLLSWCRPAGWIGPDEMQLEQGLSALLAAVARRAN